jgi:beta-galactosidase
VPDAENLLYFAVLGGRLVGVDNGRQESAESYKARHRSAFRGKAVAIVAAPTRAGVIAVTVWGPGLRPAAVSIKVRPSDERDTASAQGRAPVTWFTPGAPTAPVRLPPPGVSGLSADASFSGSEDTTPAGMVDGVTSSDGWSNAYVQQATALLPEVSAARPADWVSLAWERPRRLTGVTAWFTVDAQHSLPESVTVRYWDGHDWRPMTGTHVAWAEGSNQPTRITFDAVRTTRLRLDLTSGHPEAPNGFVEIAELAPVGG